MNIIENLEQEQIAKLTEGKNLPDFKAGDTLKVHTKVKEGDRERIQVYEGVCIARKNDGLNSSFTVRKISFGEGVERVFPLYSPNVAKLQLLVSVKFVVQNFISCAHCVVVLLVLLMICLQEQKQTQLIKLKF